VPLRRAFGGNTSPLDINETTQHAMGFATSAFFAMRCDIAA
jgi:hypothetical protein